MKIDVFQVDAFANRPFEGNPAAICPLAEWLPEPMMQAIASENNLPETAFFVPNDETYDLRWFTPSTEVDLCGHATLASAYVLFEELGYSGQEVHFNTRSGSLSVERSGDRLRMNFPAQPPVPCELPEQLVAALGTTPEDCLKSADIVAVLSSEAQVRDADPDMALLGQLDCRGIIITAQAEDYDFVARWFGPRAGIDEDPVTGSAFTQLVPYWAGRLGRSKFEAKQVSRRGGEVSCELVGDRVLIAGKAVLYMRGLIELDA